MRTYLLIHVFIITFVFLLTPTIQAIHMEGLITDEEQNNLVKEATVKIYAISNSPDYYSPWKMLEMDSGSGSGAIIEKNRVLTCAHIISDHKYIQVQRYGEVQRFNARVVSVSHEADVAILTVDSEKFFENVVPLKFGELPKIQREVLVYGYPAGGDSLSITQGILSRIEHQSYAHSSLYLLAGQIDAAVNPGNSGGPVLVDGRIVGVAMMSYDPDELENTGYMVPAPVIKHFLKDIEDGEHDGIPDIGALFQIMENPDIKRKYKMPQSRTGVLIYGVLPDSSAKGILKKEDILLSINGHPIADDGTVEFRPNERTYFTYYIEILQMGETIDVEYIRQGRINNASFKLNRRSEAFSLVPEDQYDNLPRYLIYGGIVFSPLTKNLIKSVRREYEVPEDLIVEYRNWPSEKQKEVVVAVQVLAHDINAGYHDVFCWIVNEVNGKEIRDFNEFHRLINDFNGTYMTFQDKEGWQLVIDHKKARESHDIILQHYNIPKDKDLNLGETPQAHINLGDAALEKLEEVGKTDDE